MCMYVSVCVYILDNVCSLTFIFSNSKKDRIHFSFFAQ